MRISLYIARRVVLLVPQMFLISVITFVLIRMLPGDPARLQLGPLAPQEGVDLLRKQLRLDGSVFQQYIAYVERLFQGDFGRSWVTQSAVTADLSLRIPATLELIGYGLLVVLVVLVPLGVVTSSRAGGLVTKVLKKLTFGYGLLAGALPDFWLGLLLIFVFFTTLGWAPGPEGRLGIIQQAPDKVTGLYTVDAVISGNWAILWASIVHLILPVITLAFVYGAPVFKMVRSTMTTALRSDYTTYAEGFGLPQHKILFYALRNAAPPVLVIAGVVSGYLLGGAVLIETVFGLNGVGQYAVQSITTSDYAPIQAFVLVSAIFTMLVYLLVDLVHFATDPRVRASGRKA